MRIVTMGDALIDFKATGPLAFQGYVGGSPLNVAVAAARLGAAAGLATQLSTDQFGDAIRRHLRENGVDQSLLLASEAPSSLAFVGEVEGEAVFDFIATGAADARYDPRPRQRFPESAELLMFGSISLLREPAATAITDTVRQHRERLTVLFDPNVRPALIPERAAYEARLRREWLPLSHLVKVSAQDLRWLYPGEPEAEVARRWLEHGPEAVIVTAGGAGVSFFGRGGRFRVAAPEVEVVDTVGAGDTFSGALLARLLERGRPEDEAGWRDALAFAAAAAALNCTRAGTNPPRRGELARFLGEPG